MLNGFDILSLEWIAIERAGKRLRVVSFSSSAPTLTRRPLFGRQARRENLLDAEETVNQKDEAKLITLCHRCHGNVPCPRTQVV